MNSEASNRPHITLKLERARRHLVELERVLKEYLASNPFHVAARVDPATRRPHYFVSAVRPVPDELRLIAGDAIQNLMSCLDHLAYQLVAGDAGGAPPNPRWIYFPIGDDNESYHQKKAGKLAGASDQTIAAIDEVRPYRGGNDALWQLYRLNNIEKHRLLFAVGAQAAGIHLGQLLAHQIGISMGAEAAALVEQMESYLMPADKGYPLRPDFGLYVGAPDEPINPRLQFRFSVVLQEPGVADGEPITDLLRKLEAAVQATVTALIERVK